MNPNKCFFCRSFTLFLLLSAISTFAQLPDTDLYLVTLQRQNGTIRCTTPVNLTQRKGYDNQPSFTPDGQFILYTSIRADNQADIYRYSFREKLGARVTATTESEYSATVTPDGSRISVIRVEKDSAQRLWSFDLRGKNEKILLENLKPVGYHAWMDISTLLLFVLGRPNTLVRADTKTGKTTTISNSIGRSLHKIPGEHAVSFVSKKDTARWVIQRYDGNTGKITDLAETLKGSEDYVWLPGSKAEVLLMAQGSRLFVRFLRQHNEWKEIADCSSAGIRSITRLAVSPDGSKVVFVAEGNE